MLVGTFDAHEATARKRIRIVSTRERRSHDTRTDIRDVDIAVFQRNCQRREELRVLARLKEYFKIYAKFMQKNYWNPPQYLSDARDSCFS